MGTPVMSTRKEPAIVNPIVVEQRAFILCQYPNADVPHIRRTHKASRQQATLVAKRLPANIRWKCNYSRPCAVVAKWLWHINVGAFLSSACPVR